MVVVIVVVVVVVGVVVSAVIVVVVAIVAIVASVGREVSGGTATPLAGAKRPEPEANSVENLGLAVNQSIESQKEHIKSTTERAAYMRFLRACQNKKRCPPELLTKFQTGGKDRLTLFQASRPFWVCVWLYRVRFLFACGFLLCINKLTT